MSVEETVRALRQATLLSARQFVASYKQVHPNVKPADLARLVVKAKNTRLPFTYKLAHQWITRVWKKAQINTTAQSYTARTKVNQTQN
jgi:hypothetical protein